MFNRHQILKDHYKAVIEAEYKWDVIEERFRQNLKDPDCYDQEEGEPMRLVYLFVGSVFSMTPSGKVYAFWTSNQTRADETRDAAWWEALEEVLESRGGIGHCNPDGASGEDIFFCKWMDAPEEEDEE